MPLHQKWVEENAHFGQVFGYERPLYFNKTTEPVLRFDKPDWFDQVGAEVAVAQHGVAITDLSSFGKIDVIGPDAEAALSYICSNDMTRAPGQVTYSLMLNASGGIHADLTVMRFSENHFRLSVGTAALKRDMAWLSRHVLGDVTVIDVTDRYATLGVMGPKTAGLGAALGADWLDGIGYFKHKDGDIDAIAVTAARLSYIGEAGWEITCGADDAEKLYQRLSAAGGRPIGSLAQTSMRIEKGFISYGHDVDTDVTPFMAGLEFTLDQTSDFIGKPACETAPKPAKKLVTIILDDANAVPLGNEPVIQGDRIVGKTTSAAFGYRIGRPVLLAMLEHNSCVDGQTAQVDIAGVRFDGRVKCGAAYDADGARMRSLR